MKGRKQRFVTVYSFCFVFRLGFILLVLDVRERLNLFAKASLCAPFISESIEYFID